MSPKNRPDSGRRSLAVGRLVAVSGAITVVILTLAYGAHVAFLSMMATEGDVPPSSVVDLPEGAEIRGETTDCASGGCWTTLTVRPPSGQTPDALAEELGATPQLAIPGTVADPRTVWVSARPTGGMLTLILDYWSQEWVP